MLVEDWAQHHLAVTTVVSIMKGKLHLSTVFNSGVLPYTANYRIEAVGAAGGYGLSSMNGTYRGRGAKMVGTFHLFKSEIIKILVGQEGGINLNDHASGGGGGTFVVRANNTPLIIAGGGGGGEKVTSRHSGCDASTGMAGRAGHMSWSGGSGGHGAQIADNSNSGKTSLRSAR